MNNKILLIEPCNFIDYPTGGQLTFAKHMLKSFGNQVVLVGLSTENKNIGEWTKITIDNIEFDFFPYWYLPRTNKKPIIPLRLKNFFAFYRNQKKIFRRDIKNVITQSPDSLIALKKIDSLNLCYYFAGVDNPLTISRYKFARKIAFIYDWFFLPLVSKAKIILAAADHNAINDLIIRSKNSLQIENIKQFPTRVESEIFKKIEQSKARGILKINNDKIVISTSGRLNWFKGWKFMIDSFNIFFNSHPNAILYFIGNGEDYVKIEDYINTVNLNGKVILIGFKDAQTISYYLNASDIFIMGSYKEGWSTSLIEAIACGTAACVTNFSSAKDIIEDGVNGYVCESRDEIEFANLMMKCINIDKSKLPSQSDISKYSIANLRSDLLNKWKI